MSQIQFFAHTRGPAQPEHDWIAVGQKRCLLTTFLRVAILLGGDD